MQQSQNIPFTQTQMENLKKGFTPSGTGPNRKERRSYLQKINRRPIMSMIDYTQNINGKMIYHYKTIQQKEN